MPAPAPTPTPTPPATPPPDPTERQDEDQLLDPLLAVFGDASSEPVITPAAEDPPADPAPDPEPAPADPPAAPDPAPAQPDPPVPPVKVTKRPVAASRADLEALAAKIDNASRPPLPPAAPPATAAPAAPDLSNLTPEQCEQYELVAWAEKTKPELKGKAAALLAGWKSVSAYIAQRSTDGDPVEDADSDEALKRHVASVVPQFSPAELRRLDRERIKAEAEEAAATKLRGEIDDARRLAHLARVEPIVERAVESFRASVESELKSDDEFEKPIFQEAAAVATEYASEYLRIINGIAGPDSPNFSKILTFVEAKAKAFKEAGNDLVKNGRRFVTITEYAAIPADQRASVWTFGSTESLQAFRSEAVRQAKERVKKEEESLTKRGFVRQIKPSQAPTSVPPAPAQQPTPVGPPKVSRTVAPGAGPSSPPPVETEEILGPVLSVMR